MRNRYMDFAIAGGIFGEIPRVICQALLWAKVGRCLDDLRNVRREDLLSIKGIGPKRLSIIDDLMRKEGIWYKA